MRSLFSLGLLGLLTISSAGCALPALIHDKILGPVSPIGQLHTVTVGRGFRATDQGITAEVGNEPILRPYSPDIISRLAPRPSNWHNLMKGFRAAVSSFSPVVEREFSKGIPTKVPPQVKHGVEAQRVLELLGTPDLWIQRQQGSIMAYRAELKETLSFYAGLPPFVAQFIPVPGVENLYFRYTLVESTPYKTVLFFDTKDRLRTIATNTRRVLDKRAAE